MILMQQRYGGMHSTRFVKSEKDLLICAILKILLIFM